MMMNDPLGIRREMFINEVNDLYRVKLILDSETPTFADLVQVVKIASARINVSSKGTNQMYQYDIARSRSILERAVKAMKSIAAKENNISEHRMMNENIMQAESMIEFSKHLNFGGNPIDFIKGV